VTARTVAALALSGLALVALAVPAAADSGHVAIVTPAQLAGATAVDVLDARDLAAFRAGHLPGARRLDWRDWTREKPSAWSWLVGRPGSWGLLPETGEGGAARLGARLSALGLADRRTVAVIGSGGGWGAEGRIAWMLLELGAERVWLLDGGFEAWAADPGRPVERGEGRARARGDFVVAPRPERRISADDLEARLRSPDLVLLDARTAEEFAGRTVTGQRRGGHLPGARLVPVASLFLPDGRYVDAAELRRRIGPVPEHARIVTYCTGGVRSSLLALLIEARLGVVVANYDGSMWEWSADPARPLVAGP
jgi:thiosulfate/3-mercaptopyruvate sulfurtransferase